FSRDWSSDVCSSDLAASDTYSDEDRQHIQNEIDQLLDELTRIAESTEFNTMPLLDGSFTGKRIHVGANAGQYIEVSMGDMRAGEIGRASCRGREERA